MRAQEEPANQKLIYFFKLSGYATADLAVQDTFSGQGGPTNAAESSVSSVLHRGWWRGGRELGG